MRLLAALILALLQVACGDNTEVQDIEVRQSPENEHNVTIAEDLVLYDPRYIASKISAFDSSTAAGVQFGHFVNANDGTSSVRITYDLNNPKIESKLDALKSGFAKLVPELASLHIENAPLFKQLQPEGERWARVLFTRSAPSLWRGASPLLKKRMSASQFKQMTARVMNEYLDPVSVAYTRAQYYQAFADVPESVSLFYTTTFANGAALLVRISLHENEGQWMVMGFRVEPVAL